MQILTAFALLIPAFSLLYLSLIHIYRIQRSVLPQVTGHIVEDDPVDLACGIGGVVADVAFAQSYPR